jgi:dephospho-CoA kinase
MLRVGLTGGLGCGKSTVAQLFREWGGEVIEADELGRAVMQPGQEAFSLVVERFGQEIVLPSGQLDRARLAQLAFGEGRLEELNAIIHPAVLHAQMRWMETVGVHNPQAVAIVESAIIFEVERDALARGDRNSVMAEWRCSLDCIVVVTAPEELKLARYVARVCPDGRGRRQALADARRRLEYQIPDEEKARRADFVIDNSGDLNRLREQTEAVWKILQQRATMFSA